MAVLKSPLATILALAVVWISETMAQCPVTPTQYCNRSKSDLTGWDRCTKTGTYKSISKCYPRSDGMGNVNRYDFFKCVNYGGRFLLYPGCCPGALSPTSDGTDVFNRYNEATGRCDLPPPPPPPTTTSATTGGSDATTGSAMDSTAAGDTTVPTMDTTVAPPAP